MTIAPAQSIERGKRDKELRRQALIDAATAVFAELGYDSRPRGEIAERVGLRGRTDPSLLRGKRGLLLGDPRSAGWTGRRGLRRVVYRTDPTVEEEIKNVLLVAPGHDVGAARLHARRRFAGGNRLRGRADDQRGRSTTSASRLTKEKLRRHQRAGRIRTGRRSGSIAQAIIGPGFRARILVPGFARAGPDGGAPNRHRSSCGA